MLAAACRVCVACKEPVDPSKILRPQAAASAASLPEPSALRRAPLSPPGVVLHQTVEAVGGRPRELVRFSWRIFFVVFAIWVVGGSVVQQLLGLVEGQLVLAGVQILCAVWVYYEAQQKGLPKPLRWGLGVLLLWPLIFPWYLARRNKPEAACPFVEGPAARLAPAVLFVLLVAILFLLIKGTPRK
jgi:hypothetical protein